jgi:hypothetical protein
MTFYLMLLLEYFGAPTGWVAPVTAPQAQQAEQAPQTGAKRDSATQRSARHATRGDGSKRASEQPVDDISNGF